MLAMLCSIGLTMIILACALPAYNLWWPMFVVVFYFLCPLPTKIAKRGMQSDGRAANAMFATIGIVMSSFALPIVLARAEVIQWGSCLLTLAGNVGVYATILAYYFGFESIDSGMW
ncbi:leptin receptor gene-related protein [Anopheles stephensi]|uniref:Leptin receptor gene-related protein n=1 Tax=Anopheles stephensi TaxID=30069 RepID=A0A182YMA2_ANOST|nr:leptin receptor gene-related protein [Anopheles stephensi]XP_035904415.1 leptin receptor gene-related protein [Anopheles stephensi]